MYFSVSVSMKNWCFKSFATKICSFCVTFTSLLGSLNGSVFFWRAKYGLKKVVWEKKEGEYKWVYCFPRSLSFIGLKWLFLVEVIFIPIGVKCLSVLGSFCFHSTTSLYKQKHSKREDYLQLSVFHSGSIDRG